MIKSENFFYKVVEIFIICVVTYKSMENLEEKFTSMALKFEVK